MKKLIYIFLLLILLVSSEENLYAQSGWYSTFVNNSSAINKIVKRDSTTYFAFTQSSTALLKSTDSGNNWLAFRSFDTAYSIFDAAFINSFTGWAVGEYSGGAIFKTTNGGLNWAKQNVGLPLSGLYSCYFQNENTGWIGGGNNSTAILLMTTNGGNNWMLQNFPNANAIRKIYFLNNITGYILGQNGYVGKSSNNGLNWVRIFNNTVISDKLLSDIYNIDTTNFFVLAQGYYPNLIGYIFRTSNSGINWDTLYSYSTGQNSYLYRIIFPNLNTGIACGGSNFLIKTTNLGNTWFSLNNHVYSSFSTLFLKNNYEMFAAGGNYGNSYTPLENYIIYTSNFGNSWEIKNHKWNYKFTNLTFVNNTTGYTLADSGRIFRTGNSGDNWDCVFRSNNTNLSSISFINLSTGFAVGSKLFYGQYGIIFKTTNSGISWDSNRVFPTTYLLNKILFINQNTGFVTGSSGQLYRTSNSGANWDSIYLSIAPFPTYIFNEICAIDNMNIFLLGYYNFFIPHGNSYNETIILKSSNSGLNWSTVFCASTGENVYKQCKFFNNNLGLVITQSGLRKTTDGGFTWSNVPNNLHISVSCFYMLNENTGWIGGVSNINFNGIVCKTTNSGLNWFVQFNEYGKTVRALYCLDNNNAWFCSDIYGIYKTTNGGGMIIGINEPSSNIPQSFSLSQNYPNPFNPSTTISFSIPPSRGVRGVTNVKLVIYDMLGREVEQLLNEERKPGTYEVIWDGSRFSSGVYFYKVITDDFVETKKMVLIK